MVSAGRIREGLAGRLRVACGSLAGPCGSLPGAGKDLPARTGERRREETGKADREAHLVNGKAGRRPGSPDPSAEQLYLHRQSSTVSRGQLQRKDDTRAESRARYDLPNQGSADEALTISPLFKGDTALEHYEAGLPNAYCAPWRHAGVSVVQL